MFCGLIPCFTNLVKRKLLLRCTSEDFGEGSYMTEECGKVQL